MMNDSHEAYVTQKSLYQTPLLKGKEPRLPHLDIELTERCNNACMHCYINLPMLDKRAMERELSTQQWKNILQQAAEMGALSVRITGGEPLLREDFAELYLFARRLGLEVFLFTNARLITPELADLFARLPLRKKIEITVYGMTPESYDAFACTKGAYIEFRRGVALLEERKIPFIIKSVMLPPNRSDMKPFEAWAASIPWMDKSPGYVAYLDLRARRDSPAKNRLIRKLRITPEEGVAFFAQGGEANRRDITEFIVKFMRPEGDRLFACGAGESGCVDSYGKYQMCMSLRHPDTVYDLKQGTLSEAFKKFFPRIKDLRATNPVYLSRCARCFLKGLCEQCPARSWAEHGTLDTPVEYLCQVAHAHARYLGLLGESEFGWEVADWQSRIQKLAAEAPSSSG